MAYVRFAVSHRAHFEVMYRPELYRRDDAEVREARAAAAVLLYGTASPEIVIRGVCVWRREPDGIWRIAHDISNRSEQIHPGEQPYGVTIG